MIRISIIAPAVAVRAGFRALFSGDPQVEVVAEAARANELSGELIEADVIVWSPGPATDRMVIQEELNQLAQDETKALLIVYDDPTLLQASPQLRSRAWGMLDTESSQAELTAAVIAVNEGLSVVNPAWLSQILAHSPEREAGNHKLVEPLTAREIEILQLLAGGLTNKQIAARLRISAHTVKFHVSAIFTKLGTTNRVEAVNLGLKNGLIVL